MDKNGNSVFQGMGNPDLDAHMKKVQAEQGRTTDMENIIGGQGNEKDPKEIALADLDVSIRVMNNMVMDEEKRKPILIELNNLVNAVASGKMSPEDAKDRARIITDVKSKENRGQ